MGEHPKPFGQATRCKKCDLIRPERAHHCHFCKKCILSLEENRLEKHGIGGGSSYVAGLASWHMGLTRIFVSLSPLQQLPHGLHGDLLTEEDGSSLPVDE